MTDIPRLSTTAPMDRLDEALALLRRVPLLLAGSIVGRSTDDDVLEISCVDQQGHAVLRRFDDEDRYCSTLNVIVDGLPVLQAVRTMRPGRRAPPLCSAREVSEFAIELAFELTGAVRREEGTPPPRSDLMIAQAFDLLRAAVETAGIVEGDAMMVIVPRPQPRCVRIYITTDKGSWDASPSLSALIAPLCVQSDEAYLCGLTPTWSKGPLATCSGSFLRLERPEQIGMDWESDPVATLRIAPQLPSGPLFLESPLF